MRFRIAQCLCGPARHAILAMAINDASITDAHALRGLRDIVGEVVAGSGAAWGLPAPRLNRWCALCGRTIDAWRYEIAWSREFDSWEAAQRFLRASEADQAETRGLLALLDASFDARVRRRDVQ